MIRLRLADGVWKAWAVDSTGKRVREVPLRHEGATWLLQASTIMPEGTQLAWELAR